MVRFPVIQLSACYHRLSTTIVLTFTNSLKTLLLR